jgi:ATP-dependent DNA helicase 2 subunit 2
VPPKAKGKRRRETIRPLSGLDVEELLGQNKKVKISHENSIPEFKQMLARSESLSQIEDATKQMGDIVCTLIKESFADINYDRAAENLRAMREELINFEEPGLYNNFLRGLKKKINSGQLDGDRREMWRDKIIAGRLNLITDRESEVSDITEEEAKKVCSSLPIYLV